MTRLSYRFRWLLACGFWLGNLLVARATHILGGELLYTPIAATTAGVPRYHILARLYRDPTKIEQSQVTLTCRRGSCDAAATASFETTLPRTQEVESLPLGCPGAPIIRYNVGLYEGDVDLPRGQWTLSVTFENRLADIVNLSSSVDKTLYISAFLDNALVAQNSSPKFLSTLLPYLLGAQEQHYTFGTFDSEGDSLVYSVVYPQQNLMPSQSCGTAVPGTLSPHFQLNAASGELTAPAAPAQPGYYALAARVTEYRLVNGRWQLIGWVTRDITYLVLNAPNAAPRFTGLAVGAAPQPLAQVIRVQPGQTVTLTLSAADPDAGQTLRFASQAPASIPGLRLQTIGAAQAQLTWQVPPTLPLGRYFATVAVLDDGCPNASEERTLAFVVVAARALADRPALGPEAAAFPMPFQEQVQFQAGVGTRAVTIVDALGRVVAQLGSQPDGRVRWQPAPTLPPGLYLARGADGRLLARLLRAAN